MYLRYSIRYICFTRHDSHSICIIIILPSQDIRAIGCMRYKGLNALRYTPYQIMFRTFLSLMLWISARTLTARKSIFLSFVLVVQRVRIYFSETRRLEWWSDEVITCCRNCCLRRIATTRPIAISTTSGLSNRPTGTNK